MKKQLLTAVLMKPAGPACNLGCSYCFYTPKQQRFGNHTRMSLETLETVTRQLLVQAAPNITFTWQGGEPTLMGIPFYREALRLQRSYAKANQTVHNAFMTNGFAVDTAWCDLFRDADMLVGLSVDGPRDVHDKHRTTKQGGPTWDRIASTAALLQRQGVRTNAVVVATEESCTRGREVYQSLTGMGFDHLQIVPCVERDPNDPTRLAPFSVTAQGFGRMLCDVFDCWRADFVDGAPSVSVRWLDGALQHHLGMPPTECTCSEHCGAYLVVEHDGSTYSCDFFVDDEHLLGRVHETTLGSMFRGRAHQAFIRAKARLPEDCRRCRWLPLCRGGCPKDRWRSDGRSVLCEGYLHFFAYADEELRRMAGRWKELRQPRGRSVVGPNDACPCGSGKKYKRCCSPDGPN